MAWRNWTPCCEELRSTTRPTLNGPTATAWSFRRGTAACCCTPCCT
jgi:hypothetical protein